MNMRNRDNSIVINDYCVTANRRPSNLARCYGIINNHYSNHYFRLLALALLPLLLSACSLDKPFPEKGFYAIDAGQPSTTQPAAATGPTTLQVPQLRIATPYDGSSFIYRIGPEKYVADYYNGFITSPASLLTAQLISYLSHAGLYSDVVDSNSTADYSLILEGNVTSLYGDYSHPKTPQATLAIHFFLLRQSRDGTLILHDKTYRAVVPAKDNKPDALVQAWGVAYRQILDNLIADLRAINPSQPPRQGSPSLP